MDQKEPNKGRDLTIEEEKEFRDGSSLYEMTQTSGWQVLKRMLEDRAYHSWTDPRETNNEKEWLWRELNLYHNADVARQLLEDINKAVSRSDYLGKVKSGEIPTRSMRI